MTSHIPKEKKRKQKQHPKHQSTGGPRSKWEGSVERKGSAESRTPKVVETMTDNKRFCRQEAGATKEWASPRPGSLVGNSTSFANFISPYSPLKEPGPRLVMGWNWE